MANRFVRRIKSGDIESVEDLKSEFKDLAKLTHPDLHGKGKEGEFVAARAEYEAALRDFEKHRFGASRGRDAESSARPGGDVAGNPLSDAAWLCLELMLKRGLPKSARHEKERLRYEYARWRLEQALGPRGGELFRAFESELLDMKACRSEALAPALALLRDLIEYRYAGLAAMRTHVVLSFGRMKADPRTGRAVLGFVSMLAGDLGIGGELS